MLKLSVLSSAEIQAICIISLSRFKPVVSKSKQKHVKVPFNSWIFSFGVDSSTTILEISFNSSLDTLFSKPSIMPLVSSLPSSVTPIPV